MKANLAVLENLQAVRNNAIDNVADLSTLNMSVENGSGSITPLAQKLKTIVEENKLQQVPFKKWSQEAKTIYDRLMERMLQHGAKWNTIQREVLKRFESGEATIEDALVFIPPVWYGAKEKDHNGNHLYAASPDSYS